jgi:NhaP-type Na+/H+ or K+/H+ antiporter
MNRNLRAAPTLRPLQPAARQVQLETQLFCAWFTVRGLVPYTSASRADVLMVYSQRASPVHVSVTCGRTDGLQSEGESRTRQRHVRTY